MADGSTVVPVEVDFHAIDTGADVESRLAPIFATAWPAYRRWYLRDGEERRPSYLECRDALVTHMPELVATYDRLVEAVGGGDLEARFLSHWTPPPLFAACSLAAWSRERHVLVRNYDYPPTLCDALVLRSSWTGTQVVAMSDCLLGALDGINEHGLAVAIAFGGRQVVGNGFGIGLVVRYLLEVAHDVPEALTILGRMPVHIAYNVALQDRGGRSAVAYLSPDRPMALGAGVTAANRQGATEWPEHAEFSATEDREAALERLLADDAVRPETLVQHFLEPPLFRPTALNTWGTVYTAVYDADERTMELRWPDDSWLLRMDAFEEGRRVRSMSMAVPDVVEPVTRPLVAQHRPLLIA